MSERNGEKSRFQINRRRAVKRRARVRELLASVSAGEKRTPSRPERAKR